MVKTTLTCSGNFTATIIAMMAMQALDKNPAFKRLGAALSPCWDTDLIFIISILALIALTMDPTRNPIA